MGKGNATTGSWKGRQKVVFNRMVPLEGNRTTLGGSQANEAVPNVVWGREVQEMGMANEW